MKNVKLKIKRCARCGDQHPNLLFKPFIREITTLTPPLTHYGKCPNTGEPILMRIQSVGEPVPDGFNVGEIISEQKT